MYTCIHCGEKFDQDSESSLHYCPVSKDLLEINNTGANFIVSAVAGHLLDNALLGGLIGGDILGGILGDMFEDGEIF